MMVFVSLGFSALFINAMLSSVDCYTKAVSWSYYETALSSKQSMG